MIDARLRPWVYIAAPFTKGNSVHNVNVACRAWSRLWATGIIYPVCPHWSAIQELVGPLDHDSWMEYDGPLVLSCDALLRLPGESIGADIEVQLALDHVIPVFHDEAELIVWAHQRIPLMVKGGRQ